MYISTFEKLRAPPPEASLRRFFGASAIINKERLSDYCHEIDINKIVVIN